MMWRLLRGAPRPNETSGGLSFWQNRRLVRRAGGVLDGGPADRRAMLLGCYQSAFEELADGLSTTNYASRIGVIGLFGVRSPAANAWALSAPRRAAVVVSAGLLTTTADALGAALASGRLLGDAYPSDAHGPPASIPASLAAALIGDFAGPGLTGERVDALYQLYCRVASFVVAHEIAHIARSHQAQLPGARALGGIDEATQLRGSSWADEKTRLIEFDADAHALDMLLATETPDRRLDTWTVEEACETLFVIAFAIIVTLLVIDSDSVPILRQADQGHPPPIWRAVFATSLLLDTVAAAHPLCRPMLEDQLAMAWTEAEAVAVALGRVGSRWRDAVWDDTARAWHLDAYELFRARYLEYQAGVLDPSADALQHNHGTGG